MELLLPLTGEAIGTLQRYQSYETSDCQNLCVATGSESGSQNAGCRTTGPALCMRCMTHVARRLFPAIAKLPRDPQARHKCEPENNHPHSSVWIFAVTGSRSRVHLRVSPRQHKHVPGW